MPAPTRFPATPAGVAAGADWLGANPALLETARHLARFPLATYDLLGALVEEAQDRGVRDRVATLRALGVVAHIAVPRPVGGRVHIHHLTDLGLAIVGHASDQDPAAIAARHGGTGPALLAALAAIEPTLARYAALALFLRAAPGRPTVTRWLCPWTEPVPALGGDVVVRLPALVEVTWHRVARDDTADGRRATAILVPDVPTCPVAAWETQLAGYLARRRDGQPAWACRDAPPVVIVTTSEDERRYDWGVLLDRLLAPYGLGHGTWFDAGRPVVLVEGAGGRLLHPYGRMCLPFAPAWSSGGGFYHASRHIPALLPPGVPDVPAAPPGARPIAATPPAIADAALAAALPTLPALHLHPTQWRLLGVIAELPLRRDCWLAQDLDWHPGTLHRALADLTRLGLVRRFDPRDPREFFRTERGRARAAALCAAHRPVELTVFGLAALAARAGLLSAAAATLCGYAGGGPGRDAAGRPLAFGDRASLAANYLHTDGLHGVYAHLIERVEAADAGADEVEWELGSYRPWGRIRPDAHVTYFRGGLAHPAYVEYDRGTEDTEDYRRKLGAYRAYYAAGRARAETRVLFLTTRPSHEALMVAAARLELGGPRGVPLLLTTTARVAADPRGMLGPIWRTPWSEDRSWWVPPPPRRPTEEDDCG